MACRIAESSWWRSIRSRWATFISILVTTELFSLTGDRTRFLFLGIVMLYGMSSTGKVNSTPLWRKEFSPVPITFQNCPGPARFYNQCIQKKGLTDFTSQFVVVIVGGCEGTAVLAVVDVWTKQVLHKKQLRGDIGVGEGAVGQDLEGGCEGGACQFSVVSLMIDRHHRQVCSLLLSTGQLCVIDLTSGNILFQRF